MAARIVSFNVNGLRSRLHQLEAMINQHSPDIIGLQETKVSDEEFPHQAIADLGYEVNFHGQKGHYGVALLSKAPAINITRGYPSDDEDAQRRMIHGQYSINGQTVHVINGYFPQGESRAHPTKFPAKEKFYADNDERALFFCRGVIESVKKLGWSPDVIHCNGWMASFLPMYLNKFYHDDPIFEKTKIVYSFYNHTFEGKLNKDLAKKMKSWIMGGMTYPAKEKGKAYNSAVTFDPNGQRISVYKKLHPIPILGEDKVHLEGRTIENLSIAMKFDGRPMPA